MTKKEKTKFTCSKCGQEYCHCVTCGAELSQFSEFSQWVRNLDGQNTSANATYIDLDGVWFRYRDGWYMTIEAKTHGAQLDNNQKDIQGILFQHLYNSSGMLTRTWRGLRPIKYIGHYVVTFEKSGPDDSAWVRINGTNFHGDDIAPTLQALMLQGKLDGVSIIDPGIQNFWVSAEKKNKVKVTAASNEPGNLEWRQETLWPEPRQEKLFKPDPNKGKEDSA